MRILCRDNPYLTEIETRVTVLHEQGSERSFETEQSVFYPQGGGQPGDRGTALVRSNAIEIVNSIKSPDGLGVLHQVAEESALPNLGDTLVLRLDWSQRHRFMRVHTALHLLCSAVGAPVTGGQISAVKGRLDFDLAESPDKQALEEQLNALIQADYPVSTETITNAELDANPDLVRTMSVSPPRGSGTIRMVRIGSGAQTVDFQPCGGTHVKSTAEIGQISIGKIEKKGKQNRRVNLLLCDEA